MLKIGSDTVNPAGIKAAYAGADLVYVKLPSGYARCNYVRSNVNAYFTTGLYLNSESVVVADLQFENAGGNTYGCFSGTNASDNFCLYAGSSSSDAYVRYNGEVARVFRPTSGTRYKLIHSKDGFFVDGTQVAQAFSAATFTCSNPFCVGTLSGSSSAKLKGRVYRLTVTENGGVKMDLIPCQNSNSVYGLYDLIGGTFYQSAGTAFSGG